MLPEELIHSSSFSSRAGLLEFQSVPVVTSPPQLP